MIGRDLTIYRPCAFYYEPNYAACALAFSLSLVLFQEKGERWFSGWAPGLVTAAVVLTSSRGGILGCAFTLGALLLASFFKPLADKRIVILKTIFFSGLCLGLVLLSDGGRRYLGYLVGPLGPGTIKLNAVLPHTSEGDRVISLNQGIQSLKEHPWLGQGYQPVAGIEGLVTRTLNTWVEIGMESGLLGLMAFLFAVGSIAWRCLDFRENQAASVIACVAWTVQFGINYNLAPTFPRLDYWLLFFFSINLLVFKSIDRKRGQR
jgi:O-antigen ligase